MINNHKIGSDFFIKCLRKISKLLNVKNILILIRNKQIQWGRFIT